MEPLKTGLAGLQQVSAQLRNLPPTHEWDFTWVGGPKETDCSSAGCAVGLMRALWPEQCAPHLVGWKCVSSIFELPRGGIETLFGLESGYNVELLEDSAFYYGKKYDDVTPHDVANAIDAYIAKHQPPLPTLAIIIATPQQAVREAP